MPESQDDFGQGIRSMLHKILPEAMTEFQKALKTGLSVFCCSLLTAIMLGAGCSAVVAEAVGAVCISAMMLQSSGALVGLAVQTVSEVSEYSKLLFPVMAAAASARGAVTSASAISIGTSALTAFLNSFLRRMMVPAIYLFLTASVANCALGTNSLKQIRDTIRKFSAWFLKAVLTGFLTYMSITGAVAGSTDKTALKAAKAAISTVVPVIGKTLADASEALLLSADIARNSIGIYGIFAFFGICILPFARIGAHYLVLKGIAALCSIVGSKRQTALVDDFAEAMGLLLGVTGVMCALSVIGVACFLKGVG
jgi:stage III sporulation protein AE